MDKIKVIHDKSGHTLTVWLGDPNQEDSCEETVDEVVFMKNAAGKVIGFEVLNYGADQLNAGLVVETVIQP